MGSCHWRFSREGGCNPSKRDNLQQWLSALDISESREDLLKHRLLGLHPECLLRGARVGAESLHFQPVLTLLLLLGLARCPHFENRSFRVQHSLNSRPIWLVHNHAPQSHNTVSKAVKCTQCFSMCSVGRVVLYAKTVTSRLF